MAVLWGAIAALSASALPYALILGGVRRGRLTDKNITLRAQRIRFGLVAITSILVGLVLLAVFGAPAAMVALQASIAVGVACGWVITRWWKISVHAAIAAGAATVLVVVFGPALLVVWPLVAVIGWSRVQVGDHTPGAGPGWGCPGGCGERHGLLAAGLGVADPGSASATALPRSEPPPGQPAPGGPTVEEPFRVRAGSSASTWSAPDGSSLLTSAGSSS
jgi:hypothetical protein